MRFVVKIPKYALALGLRVSGMAPVARLFPDLFNGFQPLLQFRQFIEDEILTLAQALVILLLEKVAAGQFAAAGKQHTVKVCPALNGLLVLIIIRRYD